MTGPERLDHFMARANAAYYAQRDPFADFTTSPEISQIFGELLGAWAATTWTLLGKPDPVLLIEAGPGRGTLMADAHRTITRVAPAFARALHIHFIETSPRLRAEQAKRVEHATWHDRIEDIPAGPTILLANEFLDALPIRQFERQSGLWSERHVVASTFVTLPCAAIDSELPDGAILEIGDAAQTWTATLARRLAREGGTALVIDYGYAEPACTDTLQALRHGKPADPLVQPGTADLTAHVDFAGLATTAARHGVTAWGPVGQGAFLQTLGLQARLAHLTAMHPHRAAEFAAAADRLCSPGAMGTLFKALALTSGPGVPPGFE